jgi:hypothetical protein
VRGDEAYLSLFNEDSGSTSEEFSRISWIADDVTTTEEDGSLSFDVRVAGSLVEAMRLQGDGVDSTQLLLPQVDDVAAPTLAFGDGDTGLYEFATNGIAFSTNGTRRAYLNSSGFFSSDSSGGYSLEPNAASATNPVYVFNDDTDTGIGSAAADQVTIVAGADEAWTFSEEAYGTAAGDSVAFVSDLVTAPSSNPTGGVLLYSDADTLYIRDTSGTVTDLAGAASGTNLNDIGDATAAGDVGSAEWEQTWTWDTGDVTAAAFDGFTIQMDYDASTTDSGTQNLVKLEMIDNAIDATGQAEALLLIDNNDANDAPAYGLRIDDTQPWGSGALLLPLQNDASTPTLSFGDGDTGLYQEADNQINVAVSGVDDFIFSVGFLKTETSGGSWLRDINATSTTPSLGPDHVDTDTGLGTGATDQLSLVAGGDEAWRFEEQSYGTAAGDSVAWVSDVATAPSTNPTGGVVLYSDADSLLFRDTGGDVRNLKQADPVCKTLFDSAGLADTDDVSSIHRFRNAITVQEVWCETDTGTATITLEDGSGNDLTTSCTCDNTGDTGNTCTLTANDSFTDGELLDLLMVTAAGNRLTFCVEYDYD